MFISHYTLGGPGWELTGMMRWWAWCIVSDSRFDAGADELKVCIDTNYILLSRMCMWHKIYMYTPNYMEKDEEY